jgi:ABC-type antimicrobial peptide transport system permease subunit
LNAYGSNSIALEDLRHKFIHFFELGTLGVVAIAIVIMTGTVGRMIADGRRETAVFRAIGAKRLDIASVYGVYTLCLSTCIAIFSLAVGVLAAYGFDHHFWASTTVQAQLLFGASDTSREFHFHAFNTTSIVLVMAVAIGCGMVGMVLPLLRNVRRSPIKDMREEG